eukprot:9973939-Ditylum_brightwellii.AAC.1
MPQRQNSHENDLCRSLRLQEKYEAETIKQREAHVTFGTATTMKVVFDLFLLVAMTSNLMNQFHKVYELYN